MSARSLARVLTIYCGVLLLLSLGLKRTLGVEREHAPRRSIVSTWAGGVRRSRTVVEAGDGAEERIEAARKSLARKSRGSGTVEDVLDDSPVLFKDAFLFGASFVPARDGVEVTYDDRVAYATIDDLLALKAYDHPVVIGPIRFQLGIDAEPVWAALAKELDVSVEDLLEHGRFRRLALRHRVPPEPSPPVTVETLRDASLAAGRYLARAVRPDGTYRYEVNAVTNTENEGYNWPRHSGATWFLAESALYAQDPQMLDAVERAARRLSGGALVTCGEHRCIGEGDRADLGSSALGLLALSEVVLGGRLPELTPVVTELAAFIRSQQRADGEFMHFYDRKENHPVDVQVLYYTGEAAFALGRAARITHDQKDVDAAARALDRLVTYPAWYVGWHYFWGAEHWTCHALDELWERAPNRKALRFCLDWETFVYNTAIWGREASPEYDGATSAGPFVPPAIIGTSTRMEAAVATLRVAKIAGVSAAEVDRLQAAVDAGLGFLLRSELNPGPAQVMVDPGMMRGGFPNTSTDLTVRIDNPQHAGTGLIGYLKQLERRDVH